MYKKYSVEEKKKVVSLFFDGTPVSQLTSDTDIPKSTIYRWIRESKAEEGNSSIYSPLNYYMQSFSQPHTPHDNAVMESFFSNLKKEELYRTKYRSERDLRAAVDRYIVFYNEKRPHHYNANKTPARRESEFYQRQESLRMR